MKPRPWWKPGKTGRHGASWAPETPNVAVLPAPDPEEVVLVPMTYQGITILTPIYRRFLRD